MGGRKENVQFSFKDACHIRKIRAVNGSKLIFRQLLPTMDVDFVRTGQSTVIPFPFKYIREYQNFSEFGLKAQTEKKVLRELEIKNRL